MKHRFMICFLTVLVLLAGCAAPAAPTGPSETTTPIAQSLPEDPGPAAVAIGEYLVSEPTLDEGGVSNEDCGVTLREDGSCMLYMGWGFWHEGSYELQGGQLICRSTKLEWDGGGGPGSRETDVVFTFAIREEGLLVLTDITINDPDEHDLVFPAAFSVGMTYSLSGA